MSEEVKRFTGPELKLGMTAERTKTITKKDIEYFGIVSTDTNPMHFDEEYAATGACLSTLASFITIPILMLVLG